MENKINPRWAAFKRLYPNGDKYDYMSFIQKMKRECFNCDRVLCHDAFTKFIEEYKP